MYRSSKEIVDGDDVEDIAEDVIQDKGLELSMVDISYIKVYPNISKTKLGECRVANHREHYFTGGADYIVSMSGDIWDQLDADRRRILTWHELEHVHPEYNEDKGEYNFKVRRHDVEDFAPIIEQHGVDWFDDLRTIVTSFHDLNPKQRRKVRI